MNYTWELTSIKKQDASGVSDAIIQTYWKKIGTDENGNTGTFCGATPFDSSTIDPDNFVSYEDLTEEIVLGWIQSVVNSQPGYVEHINEQIQKEINTKISPVSEEITTFPWLQN